MQILSKTTVKATSYWHKMDKTKCSCYREVLFITLYYIDTSVLLENIPLVNS